MPMWASTLMMLYLGDYREYVGTELLQPLVIGCTYHLRFRINTANNGNYWLRSGGQHRVQQRWYAVHYAHQCLVRHFWA